MSPRTNESAPDGDHGERSVATPEPDPAPPIRAATDSPGRSAARARVAAAYRTTSAHAPSTSEDTTVAAAEGTVVDRENEKNSTENDKDAVGDERTDAADGGGPGTVSGEA
nr:hypothetical protein [Streptomyces sp. RPA4-2]QIY61868.1 hypothetical protein HEP85_09470 [Streptomyces sp. RPA4-2]